MSHYELQDLVNQQDSVDLVNEDVLEITALPSYDPHDAFQKSTTLGRTPLHSVLSVDLTIHNLNVTYQPQPPAWTTFRKLVGGSKAPNPSNPKAILDDISAHMPAGSLTAIIGSSGSGKTTLLNTISHRVVSSKLKTTGHILYNGNADIRSIRSAYLMQQDVFLPSLTVRETLQYAADLRLSVASSKQERIAFVKDIIMELGLKECADTKLGSHFHKGCSGGEKRRTSLAVQMLGNPSVLFCDEPTTGLDAYSAFQVMQTLKKLAEHGRTIVVTIHSPRSEIWSLFDRVILLSTGAILYSGLASDAVSHFSNAGYVLPDLTNPAEYLIGLAAHDTRTAEAEETSIARVQMLKDFWRNEPSLVSADDLKSPTEPHVTSVEQTELPPAGGAGFIRQLETLTKRTSKITLRSPAGTFGLIGEALIIAIVAGWIYRNPGYDLSGIRSREGALYTSIGLQTYLMILIEIVRLTKDMRVFDRERAEGAAAVMPYLLSRRLANFLLEDMPVPFLYSTVFYFMVNFRYDAGTYFVFLGVNIICHYNAVGLAALCVSISRELATASLIANLIYTIQSFSCGFFLQSDQISIWIRWIKWVMFNWYAFGALSGNEFIGTDGGTLGQIYACPYPNINSPECAQYTGKFIMASLGFPTNWLWKPIVGGVINIFTSFALAALILTFFKVNIDVLGGKKQERDEARAGFNFTQVARDMRSVVVVVRNFGLNIQIRHPWKKEPAKTILSNITATFEPGKINVILGPSGSGKTSMLQSLAMRLEETALTKYRRCGDITVNGALVTPDVMRAISSFVAQDDDALMPCLTVRETLRYAAGLRLPKWMSLVEKHQRADAVLMRLGLKDCADRFIGSELKKGISGGEKRRVSIAIQVLTDPQVLILDEPTSGLDAFLASSVFDVLRALADEGRTIIVTVHQARSDLFKTFDNILLLARGGSVAYSGPREGLLPHFASRYGFNCPKETNPADFALDLITVDLQHQEREDVSRKRVNDLLADWASLQQTPDPSNTTITKPAELNHFKREMNPFRITFPLVLGRAALNIRRDPQIISARTMQVLGIGIVISLWFAPLRSNYEAIQSRMGLVQEFSAVYFVGKFHPRLHHPSDGEWDVSGEHG